MVRLWWALMVVGCAGGEVQQPPGYALGEQPSEPWLQRERWEGLPGDEVIALQVDGGDIVFDVQGAAGSRSLRLRPDGTALAHSGRVVADPGRATATRGDLRVAVATGPDATVVEVADLAMARTARWVTDPGRPALKLPTVSPEERVFVADEGGVWWLRAEGAVRVLGGDVRQLDAGRDEQGLVAVVVRDARPVVVEARPVGAAQVPMARFAAAGVLPEALYPAVEVGEGALPVEPGWLDGDLVRVRGCPADQGGVVRLEAGGLRVGARVLAATTVLRDGCGPGCEVLASAGEHGALREVARVAAVVPDDPATSSARQLWSLPGTAPGTFVGGAYGEAVPEVSACVPPIETPWSVRVVGRLLAGDTAVRTELVRDEVRALGTARGGIPLAARWPVGGGAVLRQNGARAPVPRGSSDDAAGVRAEVLDRGVRITDAAGQARQVVDAKGRSPAEVAVAADGSEVAIALAPAGLVHVDLATGRATEVTAEAVRAPSVSDGRVAYLRAGEVVVAEPLTAEARTALEAGLYGFVAAVPRWVPVAADGARCEGPEVQVAVGPSGARVRLGGVEVPVHAAVDGVSPAILQVRDGVVQVVVRGEPVGAGVRWVSAELPADVVAWVPYGRVAGEPVGGPCGG